MLITKKRNITKYPYKCLVVPSSDNEHDFENCETFKSARRKASRDPSMGVETYGFQTQEELNAFLEGYMAGVGYMGDGLYFTETPRTNLIEKGDGTYY